MEEALIKRILPHSIEAEQSVIGSMILDRDAILVASEILTSDDFYQKQYGIIFDAMVELCNEGQPVDLITLQNRLKEKELPPDISSMEYVRELLEAVPTSANIKYYANIVSEKALLRVSLRYGGGGEQLLSGKGKYRNPSGRGRKKTFQYFTEKYWRRLCTDSAGGSECH